MFHRDCISVEKDPDDIVHYPARDLINRRLYAIPVNQME